MRRPEPLTAVELDPRRAAALDRRYGDRVTVVHGDMLRFREPQHHHVVSNVPFGITTPLLRHLLGQAGWGTAVLLLQWEVARKRAAVGGTTQLTARWWPWFEFALAGRVPAAAFRPRPERRRRGARDLAAGGGRCSIWRRRGAYQRFVAEAFRSGTGLTADGRGTWTPPAG